MYFSVHKSISQCTNLFLSAQIYFSVHKCNSQCTNVFLVHKCIFSAQMYFSVHKSIYQCTNVFLSAQIYFSVHKSISQCTNVFVSAKSISQCTNLFLSAQMYFSVHKWIFFFTWCGFLIPLTRAYAQWVLPSELILCSTICIVIGCLFFSTALGCISLLFLKCVKIKSRL